MLVVLTGAGSGLGLALVDRVLAADSGTPLETATLLCLDLKLDAFAQPRFERHLKSARLIPQIVDVTDSASVAAAAATATTVVARLAPTQDIVVHVVHFAGVNQGGPLVEMTEADFERVIGVNVTGVWRVEKALFPLLRRGGGRTVIISSEVAMARATTAFSAPYPVSKVAIEGIAVALRQEFGLLGSDRPGQVILVNPGACRTPFLEASLHTNFDAHVAAGSLWSPQLVKGRAIAATYMAKNAGEPARVVDAVVDALTSAAPRARYVVNRSFEMALLAWTPQWIVDLAIAWQMR